VTAVWLVRLSGDQTASVSAESLSAEREAKLKELESRIIPEAERARLEALLLDRIEQRKADLEKMLQETSSHSDKRVGHRMPCQSRRQYPSDVELLPN